MKKKVLVLVAREYEFNEWTCNYQSQGPVRRKDLDLGGERRIILICGSNINIGTVNQYAESIVDHIRKNVDNPHQASVIVLIHHDYSKELANGVRERLSNVNIECINIREYNHTSPDYGQIRELAGCSSDVNKFDELWKRCGDPYFLMYKSLMPLVARVLANPNTQVGYPDELLRDMESWNMFWELLGKERPVLNQFCGVQIIKACEKLRDAMVKACKFLFSTQGVEPEDEEGQ